MAAKFEYKTVLASEEVTPTISDSPVHDFITRVCNKYAEEGWRTVSTMIAHQEIVFLLERELREPPENPYSPVNDPSGYMRWERQHG